MVFVYKLLFNATKIV